MKKFTLLTVALLCSFAVNAQIVSSSSRSIKVTQAPVVVEKDNFNYIRAGLSVETIGSVDVDPGYSAVVGLFNNISSNSSNAASYYGAEVGLGSRGWSTNMYEDGIDYTFKSVANYVTLSPTIGYRLGGSVKFDCHAGLFFNYDVTSAIKAKAEDWDSDTDDYVTLAEEEYEISDYYNYNPFNCGISYGIGIWFGGFNIDLTMRTSFTAPMVDCDEDTNYGVMLRLGIEF